MNTTKKPFDLLIKGHDVIIGGLVGEERFELSASCSRSRLLDFVQSLISCLRQMDVTALHMGLKALGIPRPRYPRKVG